MKRERPFQLAHRLLVRDLEKVRSHTSCRRVPHEVVERGADLHRVLWVTACRIEETVNARVVDGHLPRGELGAEIFQPVVWIYTEAVPARVGEVERHGESIKRVAFRAEELLEDALLRAEEGVAHPAVGLEPSSHYVEDPGSEPSRGLELVEHHHHALAGALREPLRQVESALEETLRVRLASELESELHVLVLHLHRWLHPRRDRLGLLEAPFDPREIHQDRVREPLAKPANVRGPEAIDVRGVPPVPPDSAKRLDDDGGLPDPSWARDQDVLRILEPLDESPQVGFPADEVGRGHRAAHGKVRRGERPVARPQHGTHHTSGVSITRWRCMQRRRGTMAGCRISLPRSSPCSPR